MAAQMIDEQQLTDAITHAVKQNNNYTTCATCPHRTTKGVNNSIVLKTPTCSALHSGHSSRQRKWLQPPTQGRGWLPAEEMSREQLTQQHGLQPVCPHLWIKVFGKANMKRAQQQVEKLCLAEETKVSTSRKFSAGCSHLSHWRLRVQQEVAERSLENPAELCEEASVVGDGPGADGGGLVSALDYLFWNTAQAPAQSDSTIRFNPTQDGEVVLLDAPSSPWVCL